MLTDAALHRLADEIATVTGVVAVSLGGSRARGTHRPDSDVDLGILVSEDVDRCALAAIASVWSRSPVSVGARGSWGPWVDSGAWLSVEGTAVDLILRDLPRVREQCERAAAGHYGFHPQPGHPFGFLDVAYAGEVALGVPLAGDLGMLRDLASSVAPYPPALRQAFLDDLWQVDFHLDAAHKTLSRGDAAYVTLCVTDAVLRLAYTWHAASGSWAVNEKGLVPHVAQLPGAPTDFGERVADVYAHIAPDPASLRAVIDRARALPRPESAQSH